MATRLKVWNAYTKLSAALFFQCRKIERLSGAAAMSVCVVGKYPWQAVRECGIDNPHSVFVLSDSKVIDDYGALPHKMAKQRVLSDNLVVCYAGHILNTTGAIDRVQGAPQPALSKSGSNSTTHTG